MGKDERTTLTVRLPLDLVEAVRRASDFDRRSVNGHIEYLLAKALYPPQGETCPWCGK
jgi:hypothetical protein